MGVRSWGAGVWRGAGNEFGDESGVGHGVHISNPAKKLVGTYGNLWELMNLWTWDLVDF